MLGTALQRGCPDCIFEGREHWGSAKRNATITLGTALFTSKASFSTGGAKFVSIPLVMIELTIMTQASS